MIRKINIYLLISTCYLATACKDIPGKADLQDGLEPIPEEQVKYWNEQTVNIAEAEAVDDFRTAFRYRDEQIDFCKRNGYPRRLFHAYFAYTQRMYNIGNIAAGDRYLDSAERVFNEYKIRDWQPRLYLLKAQDPRLDGTDSALMLYSAALEDSAYLPDNYKDVLFSGLCVAYLKKNYYREAKSYIPRIFQLGKMNPDRLSRLSGEMILYQWLYLCDIALKDTTAAFNALSIACNILKDSLNGKGNGFIYVSLGDYYYDIRNYDSALICYDKHAASLTETEDSLGITESMIRKAQAYAAKADYVNARHYLKLIEERGLPSLDVIGYLLADYYRTKYKVDKYYGNDDVLRALEETAKLEDRLHNEQKSQQLAVLEENLTRARAEQTIAQKEQNIYRQQLYTLFLVTAAVLVALAGVLLFVNQRRKKMLEAQRLKVAEQEAILEKAAVRIEAENEERKRISKEMHDDIGPALTTLNLAANMIEMEDTDESGQRALASIKSNASVLGRQMNEIIWSLNSNNDNLESLIAYIRKFATQLFQANGIIFSFRVDNNFDNISLDRHTRRNIYHAVKEVLNTLVKHDPTSRAFISAKATDEVLLFEIQFTPFAVELSGNISQSVSQAGGKCSWNNKDELIITFSIGSV